MPRANYKPKNGDDLHNYNAYKYLVVLKNTLLPPEENIGSNKSQKRVRNMLVNLQNVTEDKYHSDYAYGNLYTKIQRDLDKFTLEENEDPRILNFIEAMYLNDNYALENTYAVIQNELDITNQVGKTVQQGITDRLNEGSNVSRNTYHPQAMDSLGSKLYNVMGPTYSPQHATSMPSIRHFKYKTEDSPTEIRMGTQGQYLFYEAVVSNSFKNWLRIRHKKALQSKQRDVPQTEDKITHIYFNNLGLDRSSIEGKREKQLTEALQNLNNEEDLGIAVITLPADKGVFSNSKIFSTDGYATKEDFTKQVLAIMQEDGTHPDVPVADIHIPKKVRDIIFGDQSEENTLKNLLSQSFKAMGLSETDQLTHEQTQAVYFHFIKYELTNLILDEIRPESFNISCKDGIDRAGSASLFYNLMKSIDIAKPMNQQEFERNLHGPATMVKGRGMNDHSKRVWSLVNQYVNANYKELNQEKNEAQWLIRWRDMNLPDKKSGLFLERAQTILNEIEQDAETQTHIVPEEILEATQAFITGCMELGKDNSYDKKFLMDMIYESKSVYNATNKLDNTQKSVENALTHMDERIKRYPNEIKKLGFFEKVSKFFKKITGSLGITKEYQSTKEKFVDEEVSKVPNEGTPEKNHKFTFAHFKNAITETRSNAEQPDKVISETTENKFKL